jgi:hypothetical protein
MKKQYFFGTNVRFKESFKNIFAEIRKTYPPVFAVKAAIIELIIMYFLQ